jgi:membrane carboxypeptidase/penicillin-binding protein
MRDALRGVPENQMPMPPGIVSVLIDKETGCPARAGQSNVTFEVFRQEHVPECETVEELPDIFNDTTGIQDATGERDGSEEPGEPEESLF